MSIVIKNGHFIEPSTQTSEKLDVAIEGDQVSQIGTNLTGDEVIDASGCVVCPGLVDIHVHFREPGGESKETIATGSRAAAKGGFTSVVTMPNTNPPIDNGGMVELLNRRARETSCIRIHPAGAATKGRSGNEMTEMAELRQTGAVAVTDDGGDIASSWVMRRCFEYARMVGLTYLAHAEDATLMEGGVMNEGYQSTRLGLPGMPSAMEEIAIERVCRLSKLTGARVHICHVSSGESVHIIRRAKGQGIQVTCETAPHYWTLTDEAISESGPNAKMNPPLREAEDVAVIKQGLADGTIDCIATDHAPHTATEKDVEFALAPFGIVGLETSLALGITGLVETGVLTMERLVELMTSAPARILDLPAGAVEKGSPADITIFNPNAQWTVDPGQLASKARNTPFAGMTLRGQVTHTLCAGKVVYSAEG